MTKRRVRLGLALAAATIVCAGFHPAVHWGVYGWLRGDPFWRHRPISYWRHALDGMDIRAGLGIKVGSFLGMAPDHYAYVDVKRRPVGGPVERALAWFDRLTGSEFSKKGLAVVEAAEGTDPAAVPILLTWLDDPDPAVRAFAVKGLIAAGVAFPEARPVVKPAVAAATADAGEVPGLGRKNYTVGELARNGLVEIAFAESLSLPPSAAR